MPSARDRFKKFFSLQNRLKLWSIHHVTKQFSKFWMSTDQRRDATVEYELWRQKGYKGRGDVPRGL